MWEIGSFWENVAKEDSLALMKIQGEMLLPDEKFFLANFNFCDGRSRCRHSFWAFYFYVQILRARQARFKINICIHPACAVLCGNLEEALRNFMANSGWELGMGRWDAKHAWAGGFLASVDKP